MQIVMEVLFSCGHWSHIAASTTHHFWHHQSARLTKSRRITAKGNWLKISSRWKHFLRSSGDLQSLTTATVPSLKRKWKHCICGTQFNVFSRMYAEWFKTFPRIYLSELAKAKLTMSLCICFIDVNNKDSHMKGAMLILSRTPVPLPADLCSLALCLQRWWEAFR